VRRTPRAVSNAAVNGSTRSPRQKRSISSSHAFNGIGAALV
jgi:hypothetical protein